MVDMSKYGTKYTCYKCGCKFYDMNRGKAICPKCGADQAENQTPAARPAPPVRPRPQPIEPVFDIDPDDDGEAALDIDGDDFTLLDDDAEAGDETSEEEFADADE